MPLPAAFAIVVLVWSTTPLAVKWSSGGGVTFLEGVALRMVAGALLASLLIRAFGLTRDYSGAACRMYASGALGFFGAMGLLYWAAQFLPSGLIAVVFGVAPLFAGLFGALMLGERTLTPLRVGALLAAMAGLAILYRGEMAINADAAPAIAALVVATTFYALSSVLVKRNSVVMHPLSQVGGALWITAIGFTLVWAVTDGQLPSEAAPRTLGAIAYLSVFGSVLGFMLYFHLLARLPVATVALIPLMTPPTALSIGWLVAGEPLTRHALLGATLIVTALAIYQWGDGLWRRVFAR
ncbi:MAG: DMT family transporter [Salinisphaeraceae bacterium]